LLEVDGHVPPPVLVAVPGDREQAGATLPVFADEGHGCEIEVEVREALLDQLSRDRFLVAGIDESARQRGDRRQLTVCLRGRIGRFRRRLGRRDVGGSTVAPEVHQ